MCSRSGRSSKPWRCWWCWVLVSDDHRLDQREIAMLATLQLPGHLCATITYDGAVVQSPTRICHTRYSPPPRPWFLGSPICPSSPRLPSCSSWSLTWDTTSSTAKNPSETETKRSPSPPHPPLLLPHLLPLSQCHQRMSRPKASQVRARLRKWVTLRRDRCREMVQVRLRSRRTSS